MGRWLRWFAETPRALALLWVLFLLPRALLIGLDVAPWSDALYYYERAAELAAGKGYLSPEGVPTAFWPPGWPLALSLAFRALGTSIATVGVLNLVCAAISAWLILDLARHVAGSELAARIALLLVAVYPNNAAYVPLALTEVFYTALLLAICWLLVTRRGWAALVGAGLLLGIATLVKAQTVVAVPLILAIAVLRSDRFWAAVPRALGRGLALVAVAAVVVAPWTLRNARELGTPVAVSTNGGVTLLTGNNDSADGGYVDSDPAYRALFARRHTLGEIEFDAEARRLGMEWIAAHPDRFVALMPLKLVRLWGPDGEAAWNYEMGAAAWQSHRPLFIAARLLNQAWYWLLLAGFVLAAVIQPLQRRRAGLPLFDWWLLPYGIAAYPTAIALVFSGQSRFHYPAMPFVAMSCGWLLAHWLGGRERRAIEARAPSC